MARSFAASDSVTGVKPIEGMYRRNVMRTSGRIAFAATASVVSIRAASAAVAIGAILGIGAASAADIPPRTYTNAPATAEVYGWTGLYVGATSEESGRVARIPLTSLILGWLVGFLMGSLAILRPMRFETPR